MTHAALSARTLLLAAATAFAASAAAADTASDRQADKVHFPISCSADAQQQFDRAVAILHSFWYEEAAKEFAAAPGGYHRGSQTLIATPHCAMEQVYLRYPDDS